MNLKNLTSFIGFFLLLFIVNQFIMFADTISFGNKYVKIFVLILLFLTALYLLVLPAIVYLRKPTLKKLQEMLKGECRHDQSVIGYYKKILPAAKLDIFSQVAIGNRNTLVEWIKAYNFELITEFDAIIKQFAFKTTVSVLISPNSFLDGLAIIYGNIKMQKILIDKIGFRPTVNEILEIYTSIFALAGFTGILEEFDESLEELAENFVDEFSQYLEEKTGESIGDSVPGLNIFVKSISPILQAGSNYAFIVFQGMRFKYNFTSKLVDEPESIELIIKRARKDARESRLMFIRTMIKKMGKGSANVILSKFEELKSSAKGVFSTKKY